jgi:hypothetical protein
MYVSASFSLYSRLVMSSAQVSVVQDLDQAVYIDQDCYSLARRTARASLKRMAVGG